MTVNHVEHTLFHRVAALEQWRAVMEQHFKVEANGGLNTVLARDVRITGDDTLPMLVQRAIVEVDWQGGGPVHVSLEGVLRPELCPTVEHCIESGDTRMVVRYGGKRYQLIRMMDIPESAP